MKIGVFDSGVGGITVLEALRERFPAAKFVYLGDTANVPYGTKSAAQIRSLAAHAVGELLPSGLDALVVACNTASALAAREIQEAMGNVPVIGVVEAGVRAALSAYRRHSAGGRILVLATRATVKSGIYSRLLTAELGAGAPVSEQACPLLVPMIEEGWTTHPVLHLTIGEYVKAHVVNATPGVALLACTHYPWIQEAIEHALPGWEVVNSATAVAELLAERLPGLGKEKGAARGRRVEWIFTDPDAVPRFAREFED